MNFRKYIYIWKDKQHTAYAEKQGIRILKIT